MNTSTHPFHATDGAASPGNVSWQVGSNLASSALLLVAGAAIFALVSWLAAAITGTEHDPVPYAAATAQPAPVSAPEGNAKASAYFPAQFQNQSPRTTPEEHIQAF